MIICPPLIFSEIPVPSNSSDWECSMESIVSSVTSVIPLLISDESSRVAFPEILSGCPFLTLAISRPRWSTLSGLHLFPGIEVLPFLTLLSEDHISSAWEFAHRIFFPLIQRLSGMLPHLSLRLFKICRLIGRGELWMSGLTSEESTAPYIVMPNSHAFLQGFRNLVLYW